MPLDNNKWNGVDRRSHLEDVDPVALERRLGQIEGSVSVLAVEMKNLAESMAHMRADLKAASSHNWPEWAGVAVSTICAVAVGIGIYVAPMKESIADSQAEHVRQRDRMQKLEERVFTGEGMAENYYEHLTRYHNVGSDK